MDPASAMLLFVLFQATEKAVSYAGGKIADSMTKPIWEALEEKAKWLAGKSDTTKRWEAFSSAFAEARTKLGNEGRHPEVIKQVVGILEQFDVNDSSDKDWLNDISMQLEKASLVSEKPDEFLLVELFSNALDNQASRAELSETISDFVSIFQDILFAQSAYQETMFKRSQWQALRQPRYDTRERYISQIIKHNENLDFVGIPELKDRQALRIEDVFISLQTQVEETDFRVPDDVYDLTEATALEELNERNIRAHLGETRQKVLRPLSVNQALSESNKIVVLGDPGSGKTTLLKYIVLAYAENKVDKIGLNEERLPIFIRLYDYVSKREACGSDGFSFTDYLNKYCIDNLQLHLAPDFFEQLLERGECCVCFDGLDELGTAGIRREITAAVSAMTNRYLRNRFIVTSRVVGYEEAPLNRREFEHHTVQPLSDDDIKLFVAKWYKAREHDVVVRRERTEHLTNTIMKEERIKSLASNPLMLTIIALVHRIEAELPHERVKLYDKCVTTLVETWDKVRGIKTISRRRLLEKLAYWMHSQPGEKGRTREVREGTLRLQLAHFLRSDPKNKLDDDEIQTEVEKFIRLVKTRSGLLVERGEKIYSFSHLTFQEYLAASDIGERLDYSTDALWNEIQPPKLHDVHWREVVMLLLSSLNRFEGKGSILIRKIFENSDLYEPILHRHLFIASEALSNNVEVYASLHNTIVDALLNLARSDKFGEIALAATQALGSMKNDLYAGNGLLRLAEDEKVREYVCILAADALGKLGRVEEAGRLLLLFAGNNEVHITRRIIAVDALGQLGNAMDDNVLNGLLALAKDREGFDNLRIAAVDVLGQIGRSDDVVLNALLALAKNGERSDMRTAAVNALGQLRCADEAVLNGLRAIEREDKGTTFLPIYALYALGQLGRVEEASRLLLEIAEDDELPLALRILAAQIFGRFGSVNEACRLLLVFAEDKKAYGHNAIAAAEHLGRFGRVNEASRLLMVFARDKKIIHHHRTITAQILGRLGRVGDAGMLLLEIVADSEGAPVWWAEAIYALGKFGQVDETVLNKLVAISREIGADVSIRIASFHVLGQLGQLEHVDEAEELLLWIAGDNYGDVSDDDYYIFHDYFRQAAMRALGQLGRVDEAGKFLMKIAESRNDANHVRLTAIQALKELLG